MIDACAICGERRDEAYDDRQRCLSCAAASRPDGKRVRVEMTERQLRLIVNALDFYVHVAGLHQYEDVATQHRTGPHAAQVETMRKALCEAKAAVGLDWNAGFSVLDEKRVPERFRVALDLYQDLRGKPDDMRASSTPRVTVEAIEES